MLLPGLDGFISLSLSYQFQSINTSFRDLWKALGDAANGRLDVEVIESAASASVSPVSASASASESESASASELASASALRSEMVISRQ